MSGLMKGCSHFISEHTALAMRYAPEDAETNASHTCLKGRYAFKFYNHRDRLRSPRIRRNGAWLWSRTGWCPATWWPGLNAGAPPRFRTPRLPARS